MTHQHKFSSIDKLLRTKNNSEDTGTQPSTTFTKHAGIEGELTFSNLLKTSNEEETFLNKGS